MHWIERIEVDGFWDTHKLEVNLFQDVTFFIGPNGTGKTTLINLIAAALLADIAALDRLPFRQIKMDLVPINGKKRSSIVVQKKKGKNSPYESIEYRIRSGESQSESKFSMEDIEEQYYLTSLEPHQLNLRHQFMRKRSNNITHAIERLVNVGWLSVHRASMSEKPADSRRFESPVDQKLSDLSNTLVRYLATLSKQKDDEVLKFQQRIFLSLLQADSAGEVVEPSRSPALSVQRPAIEEIFSELHIPKDLAQTTIESYFARLDRIRKMARPSRKEKESEQEINLSREDVSVLLGIERIQALIKDWKKLGDKLSSVFEQRENFKEIVNSMLQRKSMEINESNELVFTSRSGKKLTTQMLSSGEKQLLILLSETLLQREQPYIFVADEPEISLHVLWQERLISSLRALNGSAQIIAATHSPDIVGNLSDRAINMEDIIP